MVSDATVRLATFSMLLNIIFPVFAYAFTDMEGIDYEAYDISIDLKDLLAAGIQFDVAASQNITFDATGAGHITFNASGQIVRFNWKNNGVFGDAIKVSQPSMVEIGLYSVTGDMFWLGGELSSVAVGADPRTSYVTNATIITAWEPEYNWTRLNVQHLGLTALLTPRKKALNNITQAVYDDGELTVTLGQPRQEEGGFDGGSFLDFYWDMLIGAGAWGLPGAMSWIIRILTVFTMFSAVLLAREILNPLS